jgi:hypothetical protein
LTVSQDPQAGARHARRAGLAEPDRRLAGTQIARHLHKTEALFLRWLQKQYGVR